MILIADNLQITQPAVESAITNLDPKPIQELVLACRKAGAHMIDINAGPLPKHGEKKMAFLVNTVQEVCVMPMIDCRPPSICWLNLKKWDLIENA